MSCIKIAKIIIRAIHMRNFTVIFNIILDGRKLSYVCGSSCLNVINSAVQPGICERTYFICKPIHSEPVPVAGRSDA